MGFPATHRWYSILSLSVLFKTVRLDIKSPFYVERLASHSPPLHLIAQYQLPPNANLANMLVFFLLYNARVLDRPRNTYPGRHGRVHVIKRSV